MPYVKSQSKEHRCSPPNPAKAIIGHGAGAVWQCSRCKKRWVLRDYSRRGPAWDLAKWVRSADHPDGHYA
jgi:ribosomal protein L37AE/L43A